VLATPCDIDRSDGRHILSAALDIVEMKPGKRTLLDEISESLCIPSVLKHDPKVGWIVRQPCGLADGIGVPDQGNIDLAALRRHNERLSMPAKVPMQRFYFNILSEAGFLEDLEGTELPDLEAARLEAIEDARQLMSDAVRIGYDISSRSVEVRNEAGEGVLFVPFSEALSRRD
jgi:hypothetical protein